MVSIFRHHSSDCNNCNDHRRIRFPMIYAAVILLIAAAIYCHKRDWKENLRTGRINHSKALKPKILSCIPAIILFTIHKTGWHLVMSWSTVLAGGKSILLTATWFLFLFNSLWGWRADRDVFYRSTAVGKNLPRFDKMVLHWPKGLYIFFIVVLVTGATLIYFYAS